jgi:hypothetical protein
VSLLARLRLPYQRAKDRADYKERKEDAACRRGKESERERSEREHVTCDRRHETKPERERKENPVEDRDAPISRPVVPSSVGRIVVMPHVGGLHHRYDRAAA